MADTSTSMDVEDVLTSIRRLVSEEAKGTPRVTRKLVLTNPAPELEETPEFPATDMPAEDAEDAAAPADDSALGDENAGDDFDRELSEALDRDPPDHAPEPLVLTPSLRIAGGAEGSEDGPASADADTQGLRQHPAPSSEAEIPGPIPQPEDFGIDPIVDVMVEAEEPRVAPAPPARDKPRRRWGFPTGLLRGHRGHEAEDAPGSVASEGAEADTSETAAAQQGPEPLVTVRRRTPRPRPLSLEDLIQQTTGRGAAGGTHDAGQERRPALQRSRQRPVDEGDNTEGRVLHLGQPHADAFDGSADAAAAGAPGPVTDDLDHQAEDPVTAGTEGLAAEDHATPAAEAEAPLDAAERPVDAPPEEEDAGDDRAALSPPDPEPADAPEAPSADILPPESAELSLMPEEVLEPPAAASPTTALPDVEETLLDAIRLAADVSPAPEEADQAQGADGAEEAAGGADERATALPDDPAAKADAETCVGADAAHELAELIDAADETAKATMDDLQSVRTQGAEQDDGTADAAPETDWSQLLATATAAEDAADDGTGTAPEVPLGGAPHRSASGKMLGPISDDVWDRLRSVAAEQGAEPILKAMGAAAGNGANTLQATGTPPPPAPDMILPEGALDPLPQRESSQPSPPEPAEPAEAAPDPDARLDDVAEDEMVLDEESLREMVVTILREELRGELGDRITQNVRKLVRREINRALAARDFE